MTIKACLSSSLTAHVENVLNDITALAPQLAVGDQLAKIKKLAESLRYSDPTPAPRALENALNNALNNLEDIAAGLTSLDDVNNKLPEILKAVTSADRALTDRNTAVLNAK